LPWQTLAVIYSHKSRGIERERERREEKRREEKRREEKRREERASWH